MSVFQNFWEIAFENFETFTAIFRLHVIIVIVIIKFL